jgi:hypothetical protein
MSSGSDGLQVFRRALLRAAALAPLAATCGPAAAGDDANAVVVFGDSQAEGLAAALQRLARHRTGTRIQNRTKPGTAISQAQTYDWPAALRGFVPDAGVATAVLMFGGNDRLPIHPPADNSVHFRTPAWEQEYRSRVADMIASLTAKRLRIVWVSDPICRDARYSQDMAYLNAIYRDMLKGTDATFVDIWTLVADAGGGYAAYGPAPDGTTARLRLDDGIHFTPAGYDIVAARVLQAIQAPAMAAAPAAVTPVATPSATPSATQAAPDATP